MQKLLLIKSRRALAIAIGFLTLLILNSFSAALAAPSKSQCANFDQIALQLSLAQDKMQSPVDLEKILLSLGAPGLETYSAVASYSWTYKNRALLVTISSNNITNKILIGDDDGSITSKKMEQIYAKLKTATSVWSIGEIQNQLGPAHTTNSRLHNFTWYCGFGALTIALNENNSIVSATISYTSLSNLIESRVGPNHPEWDTKTDSLGQSYRAWQRLFAI